MKRKYREIFIFVAGATPQVITETIYALGTRKQPVCLAELYIVTTSEGRRRAEAALLSGGKLAELAREHGLSLPVLTEASFIIPKDASGAELSDIRNEDENERMGDAITTLIRNKTDDPATRLHCSIAGGRKTMSFYLGAALQMFARPWDRLYHVLVSPEFESHPDFFFKPKKNTTIISRGNKLYTKDAVITLAELPFIRLRDKVSLEAKGFRELIQQGQKGIDTALTRPELRVRMSDASVFVGQKKVPLSLLHFAIYCMYLRKKIEHCSHRGRTECGECADCFPAMKGHDPKAALEDIMYAYTQVAPSRAMDYRKNHAGGVNDDDLRQAISKIKKTFRDTLGDPAFSDYYAVTALTRTYGSTRHGIRAERERIRVE